VAERFLVTVATLALLTACAQAKRDAVEANNRAVKLLKESKFEAAVDELRKAIQADGSGASFHANLGFALRELRRFDEASASLETALRLSPGHAEVEVQLGVCYRDLGKRDMSRRAWEGAAGRLPNPVDPWNAVAAFWPARALERLGELAREEDDPERARLAYERAIRAAVPFLSRPAVAKSVDERVVEDLKEMAMRNYQRLAWLYADHGDLSSARAVLANAISSPGRRAYIHSTLGYIFSTEALAASVASEKDALFLRAAGAYRNALEVQPGDSVALFGAGMSLAALSPKAGGPHRDEARRALTQFIQSLESARVDSVRVDLARTRLAELSSRP
jgi:tetratricopeptide (TPR) repeat protein